MTSAALVGADAALVLYLVAFGSAAVGCFLAYRRVEVVGDPEIERGLGWLLEMSGVWALLHVGYLLAPPDIAYAVYTLGLIVGLGTVGPWLYFCSAYTGRSIHRTPAYRRALLGLYLAIVALKLTNPIHGQYFAVESAAVPFSHLRVRPELIHWVVLGFSYILAAVGFFMLLELFSRVGHDTKPLAVLASLIALPAMFDVVSNSIPWLVEINYEPIGVAAFGIGVVYLYLWDFRTVKLAGESDEPVVVLDDDDYVRDYNVPARELFPELSGSIGEPITAVLPDVSERLRSGEAIVQTDRVGGMQYYQMAEGPFNAGGTRTGALLSFTDVTDREQYRRELERQNERLENFASMVSHDLRNPLTVAKGNIDLARKERDDEELETAAEALDRMEALIENMLDLARQGQPVDATDAVQLSDTVEGCWRMIESGDADLVLDGDVTFMADPDRLRQLLENLFRNAVKHGSTSNRTPSDDAIEHGGEDVTITVGALEDKGGFYVADNGPGIPEEDREQVFESGFTTNQDGTGFGLVIVRETAEAHGWDVRVAESESGGTRFEITGVETIT
jgi:signal transduction histidine kinase